MVTRSQAFPTKWLKPADLNGKPCDLEIERAAQETLKFNGKEQIKTALYFVGTGKSLPLNLTNFEKCEEITGQPDSDNWAGHMIEVFPSTVDVHGETRDCIRIRAPAQLDMLAAAKAPKLPPAPKGDIDDDIPF